MTLKCKCTHALPIQFYLWAYWPHKTLCSCVFYAVFGFRHSCRVTSTITWFWFLQNNLTQILHNISTKLIQMKRYVEVALRATFSFLEGWDLEQWRAAQPSIIETYPVFTLKLQLCLITSKKLVSVTVAFFHYRFDKAQFYVVNDLLKSTKWPKFVFQVDSFWKCLVHFITFCCNEYESFLGGTSFLFYKQSTILDKTCRDKSWKSSKFRKWLNFSNSKFSPLPPYMKVESGKVLLSKA